MEYVAKRAMLVTAAFTQCIQRFLSLNLVLPLAGVGVNYTHPLLGIVPYIEIRDLRWHACTSNHALPTHAEASLDFKHACHLTPPG
ncbi:MAG: hypothetical protein BGP02_14410 [Pandoraea sp. 64-18]|nr:MAG: hypothetical protein BGP02_14410 [Pandoraea sp. 64-18]